MTTSPLPSVRNGGAVLLADVPELRLAHAARLDAALRGAADFLVRNA